MVSSMINKHASTHWTPLEDALMLRLVGRYDAFHPEEPDFTPSDAISLALLAKSENSRLEFFKYYYERAFHAVASGLELAGKETLISNVRKFALAARDLAPEWHALLLLRQKLQHLATDLPASVFSAALSAEAPDAGKAVVMWYAGEAEHAAAGLLRVDAALCSFLGWNAAKRVTFDDLVRAHSFPDRSQLKTFFRPKGLQPAYEQSRP